MRYALNLDTEGRVLSATFEDFAPENKQLVDKLPDGDVSDYKYINGAFVYEPLPIKPNAEMPSEMDKLSAQVAYTAIMTDTLIEEA